MDDFDLDIDLSGFFSSVKEEKNKRKEEFKSIVGSLNLNSIFEDVNTLKKKTKKTKYNKEIKKSENIEEKVIIASNEINITENSKNNLLEKSLGLLSEPSDSKQQNDPLTPLDQKFATIEDLQNHYKLFLSRIQQQLSTLGGSGETKLRYLDDIVGIATNSIAYDGKYLQWNSTTNKAEFTDPSDAETTTIVSITGITTFYQATNIDDYIGVNANVPVTIVLPTSPITGKKITVKDEGNKISTYNITVTVGAGVSVENDTSVVMKINHQSFTYFYNGSNWFLV